MNLSEVTKQLGQRYKTWKTSQKSKDDLRKTFFDLATEEVKKRGLQTFTEHIYGPTEEVARSRAAMYFPALKVLEVEEKEGGFFAFVMEELPEFKKFTYVNPEDGQVYTRIVRSGNVSLDDDRLKEEDPELYEAVTYLPEVKRQVRDLSELDDATIAKLTPYVYEGAPQVTLSAPRKAKPEELEDG